MAKVYVTSSAFIALNDIRDPRHSHAQSFVQSLFSQTVKLYTSEIELLVAAKAIHERVGKDRALRFLKLFNEGGIVLLKPEDDYLFESTQAYKSLDKKHVKISALDIYRSILLRRKGIRRVFTFDPAIKSLGYIVTPTID